MFKESSLSKLLVTVLASSILFTAQAIACPAVGKLPDFNCDGEARIVVLGDSLAYGFGDTVNGNKGGYVLRAQKAFPNATFSNFGVQGLQSLDLILDIERAFDGRGDSDLADALMKADAVILDLGRNDRWLFGLPSATLRNLRRAAALIRKNVSKVADTSPLVIQAVLMYPNRGSQGPWVKELDALILKSSSTAAPADLRFDLVSKRLLSEDQIHPTSKGYQAITAVFVKYLRKNYPKYAALLRPDADQDGLYDVFESSKFGTDPANPDSDGDGILDGKEARLPPAPTATPTATPTPTPPAV